MLRLAEAAGGNTVANVTAGVGPSFLGYPVVFVEAGNNTLTAQKSAEGLLYFGDLRLSAMLGSRRGLTIMTSTDRYFEYDQLAIKGTERFDINVHDRGTASVAGGIVQLLAPGS
jgi:HK97 family phage major capsid protein